MCSTQLRSLRTKRPDEEPEESKMSSQRSKKINATFTSSHFGWLALTKVTKYGPELKTRQDKVGMLNTDTHKVRSTDVMMENHFGGWPFNLRQQLKLDPTLTQTAVI